MQYESCTGQCYAYSDVMRIHTLGLDAQGAVTFLKRLLAMHERACGNASLQFRLDEDTWIPKSSASQTSQTRFIASFYHYGSLDLFGGETPLEAMNKLIDAVMAWYATDEGRKLVKRDSPWSFRDGVCEHGADDKLINFCLEFSGLSQKDQEAVRALL